MVRQGRTLRATRFSCEQKRYDTPYMLLETTVHTTRKLRSGCKIREGVRPENANYAMTGITPYGYCILLEKGCANNKLSKSRCGAAEPHPTRYTLLNVMEDAPGTMGASIVHRQGLGNQP